MSRVVRRREAREDLVEIVTYFVREGSPSSARRFREQAEATFQLLADRPGMGTRYEASDPAFGKVRYFPLPSRFKTYLVFYRPLADGIEVARVLHGARDIPGILADDFGIGGDPLSTRIEAEGESD